MGVLGAADDLGKITGFDLLRGPTGFDLAKGDGCGNCCCVCTGASQPYSSAPAFSCVNADYGAYSTKTTATFMISGTPSINPFTGSPCSGTVPDPSGTWAFALGGGAFSKIYRNNKIYCQTAANWYFVQACMVFSAAGFQCNTVGTIGTWSYVSLQSILPKTGPAPVETSGWELSTAPCATGGQASDGNVTFKMPTDCCATVWQYALGPHAGGTCTEACNIPICFPKCFTNALVKATSHRMFQPGGIDYSGMTVSLAFS